MDANHYLYAIFGASPSGRAVRSYAAMRMQFSIVGTCLPLRGQPASLLASFASALTPHTAAIPKPILVFWAVISQYFNKNQ